MYSYLFLVHLIKRSTSKYSTLPKSKANPSHCSKARHIHDGAMCVFDVRCGEMHEHKRALEVDGREQVKAPEMGVRGLRRVPRLEYHLDRLVNNCHPGAIQLHSTLETRSVQSTARI